MNNFSRNSYTSTTNKQTEETTMKAFNLCRSIYRAAPHESIPNVGTAAYELLLQLSLKSLLNRNELKKNPLIGDSLNSAINVLRSEKYIFWDINDCGHSIYLNERHFSNKASVDSLARAQGRTTLAETALRRANSSMGRYRKTLEHMTEAKTCFDELYREVKNTKN